MERKHLLEKMMRAVDLDGEPIPGKTLIEIVGNQSVLIENHCGVIEYCRQQISVKTKEGCICVTGCNLTLTKMSKELLRIYGKIDHVSLRGRG